MKKIIVYDNSKAGNELVQDVIGNKHFGEIIVKRKSLERYFKEVINSVYFYDYQWKKIDSIYDMYQIADELKRYPYDGEIRILHFLSNFIITDKQKMKIIFEKLAFINEDIALMNNNEIAGVMFHNIKAYVDFLNFLPSHQSIKEVVEDLGYEKLSIGGVSNIEKIENLIQCVTGNFESRFFNSLEGDEIFITKRSCNKAKIKKEYMFWQLLPEDMKVWFVQPFNYQENDTSASYMMRRCHMTDLAIKWVHGSVEEKEFCDILQYYFIFFESRHEKEICRDEYNAVKKELYEQKVRDRILELEKKHEFKEMEQYIAVGTKYKNLENIFNKYFELKKQIENQAVPKKIISVIGHGDPCFANTIYNRITRTILFIDPKGALTEDELWTDPYYDIAKLSHSVCGLYDFFNTGLFDISLDEKFQLKLTIEFDNTKYKKIFKRVLEENGYDYNLVRIYEASLFLSMLPLHIDYPYKVLGFLLNALQILEEIENEL